MTSYVANPFQGQGAPGGGPSPVSTALRSYAPNPFTGTNPGGATKMAPHLSVAAGDRPMAADISMLQEAGFGGQMPDLDKMWRYSPQTYQSQVSDMLRQPRASTMLSALKTPQQGLDLVRGADNKVMLDASGMPIFQQGDEAPRYRYDEDGNVIGVWGQKEPGGSDE